MIKRFIDVLAHFSSASGVSARTRALAHTFATDAGTLERHVRENGESASIGADSMKMWLPPGLAHWLTDHKERFGR
jgi:hypothetical protein